VITLKNKLQATILYKGIPLLILRPSWIFIDALEQNNIEYSLKNEKGDREFFVSVNSEERLLITLLGGKLVWIPYGSFNTSEII